VKPENRLIKRVHDVLHPDVYREKMFNPMRGGTPDVYYLGFRSSLWVEYKYLPKLPSLIVPKLTPLQLAWLLRAYDRGQPVATIVGSPDGCVVSTTPLEWKKGVRRDGAQVLSPKQVAEWIEAECGLEASEGSRSERRTSTP